MPGAISRLTPRLAIAALDRGLTFLRGLEADHPDRTRPFLIEFGGSLAERHRQTGQIDRALAAWQDADAVVHRSLAAAPDGYYPRRQLIPILENWAMTLAAQGDITNARRVGERVAVVADEVAARAAQYARAPGWPPRVRAWLAELYTRLGDDMAAADARAESRLLWQTVAARPDLPADLTDEAKEALARSAR